MNFLVYVCIIWTNTWRQRHTNTLYTHTHTSKYMQVYIEAYTQKHTYIHTYIHTYMHAYLKGSYAFVCVFEQH